jgi:formyl-CoA transferase
MSVEKTERPAGALSHLRVLDLSRVLAGPWCTQILADLGADVIKVERPQVGDDTRHWGPPFLHDETGQVTQHASYFTCTNRNKRSIALDLAHPQAQALILELATQSDILVENFKVGGLQAYGLDYTTLKEINPRLIYCSITGFGQSGAYAPRAGYDLMIQAMSGMMSITGRSDQVPGGGPQRVGVALTDLFTGVYAATAILAAIEARRVSGQGQYIDMALFDVGMATLANQAAGFLNTGAVPQRQGNSHPSLAPYQDFPTADGAVLLAIGNDGQFARFCKAAGQEHWAQDERFASNTLRVRNRPALAQLIESVTSQSTTAEWIARLESLAVPCGPINDLQQAFAEQPVLDRNLIVDQPVADQRAGAPRSIRSVASPIRLSETPAVLRRAAPGLSQHADEILAELGFTEAQTVELRKSGVVQ